MNIVRSFVRAFMRVCLCSHVRNCMHACNNVSKNESPFDESWLRACGCTCIYIPRYGEWLQIKVEVVILKEKKSFEQMPPSLSPIIGAQLKLCR